MNIIARSATAAFFSSATLLSIAGLSACGTTRESKFEAAPVEKTTAAVEGATAAADLLAAAEELWTKRGEQASLEQALAKWEEAAKTTADADLYLKLSRGHYFLGDGFFGLQGDAQKRDEHYTIGLDWAEKALALQAPDFVTALKAGAKHEEAILKAPPEAVPAMYWYATNLGKWAASKGFATKLKYKDTIKSTMLHVKSLDDKYFYAAPYRYFGAFEAVTAGIAGGSLELSEKNFKKAVEMHPEYLGTKVLWADYLAKKQNNRALYEQLLNEVIAADPAVDASIEPENTQEIAKAKKLLANIDNVF